MHKMPMNDLPAQRKPEFSNSVSAQNHSKLWMLAVKYAALVRRQSSLVSRGSLTPPATNQ